LVLLSNVSTLAGVALKAVYLHGLVSMTTLTKTVSSPDHAVVLGACVTIDAVLQTEFFLAYAPVYRFVSLVQQHMHMILAHPLGILDTFPALADINLGHAIAFCGYGRNAP
jgi:hypothetical protein